MVVCSNCLRAMLRRAQIEQPNLSYSIRPQIRSFSIASRRWQQGQQESRPTPAPTVDQTTSSPSPTSQPQPSIPSKPDAKLGQKLTLPDASTSDMQKRITQNLRTQGSISHRLAESLRRTAKSATESYITYGLTEAIFKSCAAQAPYTIPEDQRMGIYTGKGPPKNAQKEDIGVPESQDSWWFRELDLEPTFSTWSQVTFLHMYICTVKLRTLPTHKMFLDYQRYLLEHFSNAAEDKMALLHGMNARGVRNRFLKDLFVQWRGILYAYDQGLLEGDAVLGAAIWRNMWKAEEDVDWQKVAMVVGFMRRAIAGMASVEIPQVANALQTSSGFWKQAQGGLDSVIGLKSAGINEPV